MISLFFVLIEKKKAALSWISHCSLTLDVWAIIDIALQKLSKISVSKFFVSFHADIYLNLSSKDFKVLSNIDFTFKCEFYKIIKVGCKHLLNQNQQNKLSH